MSEGTVSVFPDNQKPCKVAVLMTDQKIKRETEKGIWPIISELDIAAPNNTLEKEFGLLCVAVFQ